MYKHFKRPAGGPGGLVSSGDVPALQPARAGWRNGPPPRVSLPSFARRGCGGHNLISRSPPLELERTGRPSLVGRLVPPKRHSMAAPHGRLPLTAEPRRAFTPPCRRRPWRALQRGLAPPFQESRRGCGAGSAWPRARPWSVRRPRPRLGPRERGPRGAGPHACGGSSRARPRLKVRRQGIEVEVGDKSAKTGPGRGGRGRETGG